ILFARLHMWNILGILLLIGGSLAASGSRFTNIKCETLDPSFARFHECNLKLLGRGIVGLNVNATLLKGPLTVGKVNLSFWRKYNGYRPFMFNTTFDFCRFMAKNNDKLSFQKIFFNMLAESSNINHSCPYEVNKKLQDFVVRNLVSEEKHFRFLPLPTGDYKYRLKAAANNDWKAIVELYLSITEN
ncbi:hypothetical protein KR044_009204, partial [Drosophila immigrans]